MLRPNRSEGKAKAERRQEDNSVTWKASCSK